jgi:16S rRNA G966 N2-methylase RsmD
MDSLSDLTPSWHVTQIERQIPPIAHTAIYNWHKYWARKTWNVVGAFVESYCPPGGVVLDPFAGSGVTGIEAVRRGRRAILVDLTPIMEEIVWASLVDVDPDALTTAYERVKASVAAEILDLYQTHCPTCGFAQPSWANVWEEGHLTKLRYVCQNPNCGVRFEKGVPVTEQDLATFAGARAKLGTFWYPDDKLEYPDGQPFLKRERFRTLGGLFTERNLYAFSALMNAIDQEQNPHLRRLLRMAFTSVVHLGTRMMPVSDPSPTNHHTAFSALGWQSQSYWYAPRAMEKNVWQLFESSVVGHQGLVRAKEETRELFPTPVRFARSLEALYAHEGDIYLHTGDSTKFVRRLRGGSIDYVFTDPPYDASIQYGELSFLWVAWLRKARGYLESITEDEVIRNDRQHKSSTVYQALLRNSFQRSFEVLTDDAYLTVTFHNPSLEVRNATIQAGTHAGFAFEKIHHQPTAVRSAKSLQQPFGSAQGDFYLRFHKLPHAVSGLVPPTRDDERFERVVVDTTTGILAERGEPTSYTIIINKIDPELARHGFFSSLSTGLDVKKVLKAHLDKEFVLVPATAGSSKGELWWFKDPGIIPHPEIPLSERVEATVLRQLQARGNVEFTDAWEAVSTEFPNSLTPDTTSILDALKTYARPATGSLGRWLLKPEVATRENQHNEVLATLADIGSAWGLEIWVGKKEQSASVSGAGVARRKLADLVTADLSRWKSDIADLRTAQQLDCVWVGPAGPVACFEVESTTSMTSGLMRGSNLLGKIRRYLVIPEEREGQLSAKMRSPLFQQRFDDDGWIVLHFDHVLNNARRLRKAKGNWDALLGADEPVGAAPRPPKPKQMVLDLGSS